LAVPHSADERVPLSSLDGFTVVRIKIDPRSQLGLNLELVGARGDFDVAGAGTAMVSLFFSHASLSAAKIKVAGYETGQLVSDRSRIERLADRTDSLWKYEARLAFTSGHLDFRYAEAYRIVAGVHG
jgi:hypothetical protein